MWDVESGKPCNEAPSATDLAVAFSPCGEVLAHVEERPDPKNKEISLSSIHLLEGHPLKPVRSLDGHDAEVVQVAFSLDGKTLVSASHDQTLRVWDEATGNTRATFHDDGVVQAVAAAPDGTRFASGGEDGVVKIWAMKQPEPRVLGSGRGGVAFSPDGLQVAVTRGSTAVLDAQTGKELASTRQARAGLSTGLEPSRPLSGLLGFHLGS